MDMMTHGSSYGLLNKLNILTDSINPLSKDDQLSIFRKELAGNIKAAYETTRNVYNLRARPICFKIGQEVFRRNFSQSSQAKKYNAKLAPIFIKAKIREKVGNHYYILEDSQGKILGTYHAKDIRT